ncbi:MAG: ATP-binding protein, partial [Burkholderiaceae bacterium]
MPAPLSSTAVTYLFTDVEGSTRLWESEPDRIGPALARHDQLSRATVERHRGWVVKMTGDGMHAAFAEPADAMSAAIELQTILADSGMAGDLPLSVRCGLHVGADERRDNDFFGRDVNRAARIMDAAHGGQILVSMALAERVRQNLPPGASLRDLGMVRLRDLTAPDHLYQVVHRRLRSEFPALRSLASAANNLPQQLNSFVGREREMREVRALLGANRIVTLLAMGGIGKSRLSIQLAAEALDEYPDGVWLVELAALTDPREVVQAVAGVLGVKEEGGRPPVDALARFVADRQLLLVLDNCEHLIRACADLAKQLLRASPGLKILATSRDVLQVAGEAVYYLPTLSVP